MRIKNKTAIITAASRSLGRAIAVKNASEGASVVINYVSDDRAAQQVVEQIKQFGGSAIALKADVSDETEVRKLIDHAMNMFGRIDILVNNAGTDPRKPWMEITGDEWDHVMKVNVKSQFLCAKAVFPYMLKQGGGHIINVSSVVFWKGIAGYVHYVASKGAIIGLTRALAREVGEHNIRVNCVTPGAVLTETEEAKLGSREAQTKATAYLLSEQSLKRRMTTDDIVGTFVFLGTEGSGFMTGQCINVDGGWMMH